MSEWPSQGLANKGKTSKVVYGSGGSRQGENGEVGLQLLNIKIESTNNVKKEIIALCSNDVCIGKVEKID